MKPLLQKTLIFLTASTILFSCKVDDLEPTPEPAPMLNVEQSELSFSDDAAQSYIDVTSNVEWWLSGATEWCSVDKSSGNGTQKVKVTVSANQEYEGRSVQLAFSVKGITEIVTITQNKKGALIVGKTLYVVGSNGGVIDVKVKSDLPYSVIIPPGATWIKQIATSWSNLQFSVDSSPEGVKVRETDISIKDATTNTTDTLTVRQVVELSFTLDVKTPGTLRNLLTYDEKMSAVSIILTGELNYSDFRTMRGEMPLLKYVDISKTSIAVIPSSAFCDKASIESIALPEIVRTIEYEAFWGCSSLTAINIPAGVTTIERHAFWNCSSLTAINIPAGVTTIRDYAFYGCSSLTAINIPAGVTTIRDYAFYGCSSLTAINVPAGVTTIGSSAFSGCSSLTAINIPAGVTTIGTSTFSECSSLTAINIPAGVTTIGYFAFRGCSSLTAINIPAGVTTIGREAFSDCSSLTAINIPAGVTTIGSYTFSGCSSLTAINIPAGVTTIGSYTFSGCSSLTAINIPAGVTTIGTSAFSRCRNLQEVICNTTTPPSIENWGTFYETPTTKILKVPSGSVEAYKQSNWSDNFKNIQPIQ